MIIKFWGVRGSIPTPGYPGYIKRRLKAALAEAVRVRPAPDRLDEFIDSLPPSVNSQIGGNTPCLEITHEGERLIIDAGTGIAPLGLELNLRRLTSGLNPVLPVETLLPGPFLPGPESANRPISLLFTHTHWDHIQGFPFFRPAYHPENAIDIYGADSKQVESTLALQQSSAKLFPIQLRDAGASLRFHDFPIGQGLALGPFSIEALPLPHPGGSLAFKISAGGRAVVFATYYELREADPDSGRARAALQSFLEGADVFISDTQYTYLENLNKEGWGHSNPLNVVEMALQCDVKRFFLFHHDPHYSDAKLFDMLDMTISYINFLHPGNALEINLAIEGREIRL